MEPGRRCDPITPKGALEDVLGAEGRAPGQRAGAVVRCQAPGAAALRVAQELLSRRLVLRQRYNTSHAALHAQHSTFFELVGLLKFDGALQDGDGRALRCALGRVRRAQRVHQLHRRLPA